jgi:hypothetical protein
MTSIRTNQAKNRVMKRQKVDHKDQSTLVAKSNQTHGDLNRKNRIPTLVSPSITPADQVIDEADLEPPEPDYAHLPARPFQTQSQLRNAAPIGSGVGRGKKHTIKETDLAPLKEQIDKANAARAFKERFSSGPRGKVVTVGQDGIARRQQRGTVDEEAAEDVDDIDQFLAELDMQGIHPSFTY